VPVPTPRSYGKENDDHLIALFSLTDAGIKAAKDSPRRLDAAKKLLTEAAMLFRREGTEINPTSPARLVRTISPSRRHWKGI
jgi:hypothetical protein